MTQGNLNKWHRIALLVNQHSKQLLSYPSLDRQFKKLVLQRLFIINCFTFLLQYSGLKLSTFLSFPAPLWYATGSACALIFLRGYCILPGVWLGSFLAYILEGAVFLTAIGCATVFSLQAMILRAFNYRFLDPTLIFYRSTMYCKFVLFTMTLSGLTTILLLFFYSFSISSQEISYQQFLQWWLANVNAILIFSCALVTWDSYFQPPPIKKLGIKRLSLYSLLLILIIFLNQSNAPLVTIVLAIAHLMVIIAISVNFGWVGIMTAVFCSGFLFCLAAFMETPLFNTNHISRTVFYIQLLLLSETIIGVILALSKSKPIEEH